MQKIPLTRGEVAWVDDEDFERVNQFKWYCHVDQRGDKYAVRSTRINGAKKTVAMHRFICPHGLPHTDHRDGNRLNNQRSNLRPATQSQNLRNRKNQEHSSRFKGVTFFKRDGNWQAKIRAQGKSLHLGYFNDEEIAAKAYDAAAIQYFGSFARTNHSMGLL